MKSILNLFRKLPPVVESVEPVEPPKPKRVRKPSLTVDSVIDETKPFAVKYTTRITGEPIQYAGVVIDTIHVDKYNSKTYIVLNMDSQPPSIVWIDSRLCSPHKMLVNIDKSYLNKDNWNLITKKYKV